MLSAARSTLMFSDCARSWGPLPTSSKRFAAWATECAFPRRNDPSVNISIATVSLVFIPADSLFRNFVSCLGCGHVGLGGKPRRDFDRLPFKSRNYSGVFYGRLLCGHRGVGRHGSAATHSIGAFD